MQEYRVTYEIDVSASSPINAAIVAYEIMTDPTSLGPVLSVLDYHGIETVIDLSD